jgi:hypothetical protein
MNKKAQLGIGAFLVLFIGIVVSLTLYTNGIAPNIGTSTQTVTLNNVTTAVAALGGNVTLAGREVVGTPTFTNATANATEVFPAGAFTVNNNQVVNGELVIRLTTNNASWAGRNVNITYTYEPAGYPNDAGSRSIISLIAIFAMLGVVAVVINNLSDGGLFDYFKS